MKRFLKILLITLLSCNGAEDKMAVDSENIDQAQAIVDKAIEKAGGDRFKKAVIDFDFRDLHYRSERRDGLFTYYRIKVDSSGEVKDVLNNQGFQRYYNGDQVDVIDTMAAKYTNSVNSVIYFAQLPYGLNDPAVNKEYLGKETIKGSEYHKIKVTFDEIGGGEDHQDVFIYWIDTDSYAVDYLAYSYETEGGGIRFRQAINPRYVNGIRFVDYINYKPETDTVSVENTDSLFNTGRLDTLSEINLENIEVEVLDN